jgi:hypothetical protein
MAHRSVSPGLAIFSIGIYVLYSIWAYRISASGRASGARAGRQRFPGGRLGDLLSRLGDLLSRLGDLLSFLGDLLDGLGISWSGLGEACLDV